jgi:hypothetical protein
LWEDTTERPELRARAGKDRGGEPDVVLACAGDIPTLETVAAEAIRSGHHESAGSDPNDGIP